MYQSLGATTTGAGAAGATLAVTGASVLGWIMAAIILIFAGVSVLKFVPRKES